MAELFSHVLFAFALFTVVGWWVEWLDRRWVSVAMVGAIFPDLNRIGMLVDAHLVSEGLGVPFGWGAIHTLGGVLVLSVMGAILFQSRTEQIRAFILLFGGALTHIFTDVLKMWADGYASPYLYPFTWWRVPTPGLYVSADRWVAAVMMLLAVMVMLIDYVRSTKQVTVEGTGGEDVA